MFTLLTPLPQRKGRERERERERGERGERERERDERERERERERENGSKQVQGGNLHDCHCGLDPQQKTYIRAAIRCGEKKSGQVKAWYGR